jgi:hypothetical protein
LYEPGESDSRAGWFGCPALEAKPGCAPIVGGIRAAQNGGQIGRRRPRWRAPPPHSHHPPCAPIAA